MGPLVASKPNVINFQGVKIVIPASVPFNYQGDTLVLNFSQGFRGELCLQKAPQGTAQRPVPLLENLPNQISEAPTRVSMSGRDDIPADELANLLFQTSEGSQAEPQPPSTAYHGRLPTILGPPSVEKPVTPAEFATGGCQPQPLAERLRPEPMHSGPAQHSPLSDEGMPDKENLPCEVAPLSITQKGQGSASGTDKRKPEQGGIRAAKRARGPVLAEPCPEFRWTQVTAGSNDGKLCVVPKPRWGATLVSIASGKVCLCGGANDEGELGDTWLLNVATLEWTSLCDQPAQRKAWHAVAPVTAPGGDRLLSFGGEQCPAEGAASTGGVEEEQDPVALDDALLWDMEQQLWVSINLSAKSGESLPKRTGHSLTELPDGRALLFGGLDHNGKFCNDAYVLDARNMTWMILKGIIRGAPPKARAYHTATLVGDQIIVLGGMGPNRAWSFKEVYTLTPGTWAWREHTNAVEGDVPTPRSGHSAVALPGGRHLLVFGGGTADDDLFLNSAHLLDTVTWRWTLVNMPGHLRPSGRSGHGMVCATRDGHPVMVLHGGRAKGDAVLQDTWLLEMN